MLLTVNIIDKTNAVLTADITVNSITTTGVSTVTSSITNNSIILITVAKTGYYTYTKEIKVFNVAETIVIKLVNVITVISDPDYLKPFPAYFTIKNPCTYEVYIYNASSGPWNGIVYYVNNERISTDQDVVFNFGSFGVYQIKQRQFSKDPVTTVILFDYYLGSILFQNLTLTEAQCLASDIITNYTLSNIIPEFTIELTNPDSIFDSINYYNVNSPISATPTFLENNSDCTSTPILDYKLYNASGNLVDEYTVSTSASSSLWVYTFTPQEIGDYTLVSSFIDCCNAFKITTIIPIADFVVLYPATDSCKDYILSNRSNTINIVVTVSSITGVSVLTSTTILAGSAVEFVLPDIGTYKVDVTYILDSIPVEKLYIITAYCDIEECLAQYIIKLYCNSDCGCKDTSELKMIISRMNALLFDYFSILNNLYMFNRTFDVLSQTDLDAFRDSDIILQKLKDFCNGSGCGCGC